MEWTIHIEAAGTRAAGRDFPNRVNRLADELADQGGATSYDQDHKRYTATFTIEAGDDPAAAWTAGAATFKAVAAAANLPDWPIVRVELMTVAEQERDLAQPAFPALVGVSEIAELLGVTRQRASQLAKSPQFPEPVARLANTPVWTADSLTRFVEDWARKPGRPPATVADHLATAMSTAGAHTLGDLLTERRVRS